MKFTLKKFFGYSEFRPYQKEVIEKILQGRDCLVVMATGSGKSLCYQVPPLIAQKTAVVVSPLISLMQDQVMALKQRGIKAEYLGSTQANHSVQTMAQNGDFQLVFMTPEKACSLPASFWSKLQEVGISLFAIDEAHCISEWGHDFRVEYKQLDELREVLLDVPFVALTATATERVRKDIMSSLKMKDPYIAIGSFDRKNLFYGVKHFYKGPTFVAELVQEISKFAGTTGSTIIYCTRIKDVDKVSKSLQDSGIKNSIYHGQMSSKARKESHRSFVRDEVHVMIATIAFGMGIDKPDIRQVIHYGCPKSVECYYQESGRCGRDGVPSVCWLYYTRSDFTKADFYTKDIKTENQRRAIVESLLAAQQYCLITTCRRKFLLEHFGEMSSPDKCGNCDNCMVTTRERDFSKEAYLLLTVIQSCGGHWGLNVPVDVLRGSRAKKLLDVEFDKLPLHGLGKYRSSNWWKALARQLIFHGYLVETVNDVYRKIHLSQKGKQYLSSAGPDHQHPLILPLTNEMVEDDKPQIAAPEVGELKSLSCFQSEGISEIELQLYHMLLEERMKLARNMGTAPYAICGDLTIKRIALTRPSTKARLANIDGVNQHLLVTHGDVLLQIIKRLSQELNLSLDGEAGIQTSNISKLNSVPNNPRKLTPAKLDAWKMWHEEGLSISKIANFPGRPAPIKEQTVAEYLLDAAQEGLDIDWTRLCKEVGLTHDVLSHIQAAVSKVGTVEKLKPIKNELPEHISYAHIKICLAMQSCGMSSKLFLPIQVNMVSDADGLCELDKSIRIMDRECCLEDNKELTSINLPRVQEEVVHFAADDILPSPQKRQRVDRSAGIPTALEATESSILNLLKNHDGVSLSDILEHFHWAKEEAVVELLSSLESDFMIYNKNGCYRLL